MDEAETLCDRVAVMDHGEVLRVGPLGKLVEELGVDTLEDVFLQLTGA
jgi:ABC-2 type transport system ATP-binding protein